MQTARPPVRGRFGFTLIELLVVIAIIAILIGLLLPAVQKVREAAARAKCSNNVKQLAIACHAYHDVNNALPPGAQGSMAAGTSSGNAAAINGTSWIVFCLPYIEQAPLYNLYTFSQSYNVAANAAVGAVVVPTIYCPAGPSPTTYTDPNAVVSGNPSTHYYGIMGPGGPADNTPNTVSGITYTYRVGGSPPSNGQWAYNGMLVYNQTATNTSISYNHTVRLTDATDGTTNTLMIGEMSMTLPSGQANQYRTWIRGNASGSGAAKSITNPINSTFYNGSNNFNDISMGSNHPTGCNFGMGDGSVRYMRQSIDLSIYKAMASCNSGEVASAN